MHSRRQNLLAAVRDMDMSRVLQWERVQLQETLPAAQTTAPRPAFGPDLRVRSALLSSINDRITEKRWDADTTADTLGLTQPRVTELSAGHLDRFTLDDLVSIGITIGIRLEVTRDRTSG